MQLLRVMALLDLLTGTDSRTRYPKTSARPGMAGDDTNHRDGGDSAEDLDEDVPEADDGPDNDGPQDDTADSGGDEGNGPDDGDYSGDGEHGGGGPGGNGGPWEGPGGSRAWWVGGWAGR